MLHANMSYLKPLITLNFWFNTNPPPFVAPVFIGLGIFLAVVFVAGIVVKWFAYAKRGNPPLHRVLSRLGRALISVSLVGAFFYFVSYEQTPVVSARFWWLILLAAAIVWKVFIILDIIKRYPIEKKARVERLAREKYLPK
jgi:hypothetical protein